MIQFVISGPGLCRIRDGDVEIGSVALTADRTRWWASLDANPANSLDVTADMTGVLSHERMAEITVELGYVG